MNFGYLGDILLLIMLLDKGYTCDFIGFLVWRVFIFPYVGKNNPNWLSYFSEGLTPPSGMGFNWFPSSPRFRRSPPLRGAPASASPRALDLAPADEEAVQLLVMEPHGERMIFPATNEMNCDLSMSWIKSLHMLIIYDSMLFFFIFF